MSRVLAALARAGDRVPDPVVLFVGLGAALLVASKAAAWAGIAAVHPVTGELVQAVDLLDGDGLQRILTRAVANLAGFPPLATVVCAMIGIGVAEGAGLFDAALARIARAPAPLLAPAVLFAGLESSIAADAGFVVLVPLGAALYAQAGRSPVAGLATAFAGVSAGYSANLLVVGLDPLLAGLTEAGARLIDPAARVSAVANWWFFAASVPLLLAVGTAVSVGVERRLPAPAPGSAGAALGPDRALWAALLTGVGCLAGIGALSVGVLRDASGTLAPLYEATVPLVSLSFGAAGVAYGWTSGRWSRVAEVPRAAAASVSTLGGYLVLAFAAAQVIAWFSWSNLGTIVAIRGAAALDGAPVPALLTGLIGLTALLDLVIASASAKWAILAPIFVPMLALLGVPPAVAQAAYRVGDSPFNVVSPLLPYLPMVLATLQRHAPQAGLGTLLSAMVPFALAFLTSWTALLLVWVGLGWPLGPA
jgi:aminobenzoyl-glutamate transport protein